MLNFVSSHWKVIVIGIVGLMLGALANYIANQITNKQLLEDITAQINALQGKGSRLTSENQIQLIQLRAQQKLLAST